MWAIFGFLVGLIVGAVLEHIRKIQDLKMDADRHVTFIQGTPHKLIRYGAKENYPGEADDT